MKIAEPAVLLVHRSRYLSGGGGTNTESCITAPCTLIKEVVLGTYPTCDERTTASIRRYPTCSYGIQSRQPQGYARSLAVSLTGSDRVARGGEMAADTHRGVHSLYDVRYFPAYAHDWNGGLPDAAPAAHSPPLFTRRRWTRPFGTSTLQTTKPWPICLCPHTCSDSLLARWCWRR